MAEKDLMDPAALRLAQALVDAGWKDLRVNSAYRDPVHNARVDGRKESQHIPGKAFDINVSGMDEATKARFLADAVRGGARGVGIYPSGNVIHIDVREGPPVFWGPRGTHGHKLEQMPAWAQPALRAMAEGRGTAMAQKEKPPALPPAPADDFASIAAKVKAGIKSQNVEEGQTYEALRDRIKTGIAERNGASAASEDASASLAARLMGHTTGRRASEVQAEIDQAGEAQRVRAGLADLWGTGGALGNGMTVGAGPAILGAIGATDQAIRKGTLSDWSKDYALDKDIWNDARQEWNTANPGKQLVAEGIGAAATLGAGQAKVGNALYKAAAPHMPRVANFLAGNSGPVSQAASGGLTGAVGGALSTNLGTGNPLEDAKTGALVGGALGPIVGGLAQRYGGYAVPPRQVGEQAASLVRQGVDVKGPQILGRTKGEPGQLAEYTRAVARRLGVDDLLTGNQTGFTSAILKEAEKRNGQKFEEVLKAIGPKGVPLDQKFQDDLVNLYRQVVVDKAGPFNDATRSEIAKNIHDILDRVAVNGGQAIPAKEFQHMLSNKGFIGKMLSSADDGVKDAGWVLNSAFFDALERSAPGQADALRAAKTSWQNLLQLKPTVAAAIEKSGGIIDPSRMTTVAAKSRATPDVKELARGAAMLPKPSAVGEAAATAAPKEGPAWKKALTSIPQGIGQGAGLGMAYGGLNALPSLLEAAKANPAHAVTGLLGAGVAGAGTLGARAWANSKAYRDQLIKNALAGEAPPLGPVIGTVTAPAASIINEPKEPLRIYVTPRKEGE